MKNFASYIEILLVHKFLFWKIAIFLSFSFFVFSWIIFSSREEVLQGTFSSQLAFVIDVAPISRKVLERG